jgi:hypothetical protein
MLEAGARVCSEGGDAPGCVCGAHRGGGGVEGGGWGMASFHVTCATPSPTAQQNAFWGLLYCSTDLRRLARVATTGATLRGSALVQGDLMVTADWFLTGKLQATEDGPLVACVLAQTASIQGASVPHVNPRG